MSQLDNSQLKLKTYSTVTNAQVKQGVLSVLCCGLASLRIVVKVQQREQETTVNGQSVKYRTTLISRYDHSSIYVGAPPHGRKWARARWRACVLLNRNQAPVPEQEKQLYRTSTFKLMICMCELVIIWLL